MACSYCKTETHTWTTPDAKRICFNCLRQQRDAAVAEVAALKQAAADLSRQIPPLITDIGEERGEWEKSLAAACQRISASEEANRALECRLRESVARDSSGMLIILKDDMRQCVVTIQQILRRLESGP